jgi:phosphatidylglycerophosphatase A
MKNFIVKFLASGLGSGYLKPFPGTWGTIPAWLIAWFLLKGDPPLLWGAAIISIALSIAVASLAEPLMGHDSRKIVIDEWAGMFVSLLFVPYSLQIYIGVFIVFRAFDVIKLWPARQLESLPGGLGVTMDDVAAGIQSILLVQIIIYAVNQLA